MIREKFTLRRDYFGNKRCGKRRRNEEDGYVQA
jgi:hypothetical protein